MKFQTAKLINTVCMTLCIALVSFSVNAARYTFSQGGFSGSVDSGNGTLTSFNNGRVFGSFEAEDKYDKLGNPGPDGLIFGGAFEQSELTKFSLNFVEIHFSKRYTTLQ